MNFLHFCPDDKFILFFQKCFEEIYPGKNKFRIFVEDSGNIKFAEKIGDTKAVGREYWSNNKFLIDAEGCDCLVVNYMFHEYARAINMLPINIKIIWVSWGADYYDYLKPQFSSFLLNKTAALVDSLNKKTILQRISSNLKKLITNPYQLKLDIAYLIRRNRYGTGSGLDKVINRIDFFSMYEEELPYFRKAFPAHKMKFLKLQLYSAEDTFAPGGQMRGSDILVGNSSTPTNNHIEILDVLSNIDIGQRCIICPLSYGDMRYGDKIEAYGQMLFGKQFIPLRKFMDHNTYNTYLSRCGIVIMNHIRQQGATTIATALYKGAIVYLREENPMYSFYKKMDSNIRTIKELQIDGKFAKPSSSSQIAIIQKSLLDYWGRQNFLNEISKISKIISKEV